MMNWKDSKKIDELVSYVALLAVSGVGPKTLDKLVRAYGSATDALERGVSDMVESAGIGRAVASTISTALDIKKARESVAIVHERGWNVLLDTDPEYPGLLLEIHARPPVLFYLGELRDSDIQAVGVVGSRLSTESGREFAKKTGADLAGADITVVSGMARGIDTAAHLGALDAGGRTLAVLGCALDYKFSPSDKKKISRIVESGAVISEFPPGTPTLPENFPRRNRIISGLSQAVIVIEASAKSGALLTANNAIDQNRELFATPGFPWANQCRGTNSLIKQGAHLFTGVADLFERLPRLKRQVKARAVTRLEAFTEVERRLIDSFTDGPQQIDKLSLDLGLPIADVIPTLLALELKGVVRELSGKRFALNE